MDAKSLALLAFAAGLAGGLVSQRIGASSVHAQASTPAPKEIRAEKFVIVDESGAPRGALGIAPRRNWPELELIDQKGHVYRPRLDMEDFWGRKSIPEVVPPK